MLIGGSAAILLNSEYAKVLLQRGKLPQCAAELRCGLGCFVHPDAQRAFASLLEGWWFITAAGGVRLLQLRFACCHHELPLGVGQSAGYGEACTLQAL